MDTLITKLVLFSHCVVIKMEIDPGRDFHPTRRTEYNEPSLMMGVFGCLLLIGNLTIWLAYSLDVLPYEFYIFYWSSFLGYIVIIAGYIMVALGFLTIYQNHLHPILALTCIMFIGEAILVVVNYAYPSEIVHSAREIFWIALFLIGGLAFLMFRLQGLTEVIFTLTGILYFIAMITEIIDILPVVRNIAVMLVWVFTGLSFYYLRSTSHT